MEAMGGSDGKQMASGSCGHVYCRDCLLAALKVQKKCPACRYVAAAPTPWSAWTQRGPLCPKRAPLFSAICRKSLQPKQVHNVFLSMS